MELNKKIQIYQIEFTGILVRRSTSRHRLTTIWFYIFIHFCYYFVRLQYVKKSIGNQREQIVSCPSKKFRFDKLKSVWQPTLSEAHTHIHTLIVNLYLLFCRNKLITPDDGLSAEYVITLNENQIALINFYYMQYKNPNE